MEHHWAVLATDLSSRGHRRLRIHPRDSHPPGPFLGLAAPRAGFVADERVLDGPPPPTGRLALGGAAGGGHFCPSLVLAVSGVQRERQGAGWVAMGLSRRRQRAHGRAGFASGGCAAARDALSHAASARVTMVAVGTQSGDVQLDVREARLQYDVRRAVQACVPLTTACPGDGVCRMGVRTTATDKNPLRKRENDIGGVYSAVWCIACMAVYCMPAVWNVYYETR